jgi:FkbM family methyltransferase
MEVLAATGGARTEVFVDVGANLGTTTLAALELHGFDRAVAIEPDPENVRFLRATVAANGFDDRVAVVEAAVADHVGEAAFAARAAAPGGRKSGSGGLSAGGGDLVGVTTLDALAEQGLFRPEQVGLLWMDAQGAEGHALAGAGRLLDYRVPVVSAVRPRRLAKLGGLEMFRELVRARYPQFVDLRAPNLEPGWSAVVRPVADLDELLTGESTDVLLLP